MITKNKHTLMIAAVSCLTISACGRLGESMPSMLNTNRAELIEQSVLDSRELNQVDENYLALLAEQSRKYGEGPVDLTVTYDPASKSFTALKAINTLEEIEDALRKQGTTNITTQTLPVEGRAPSLIVAFDTVGVQPPSSCTEIPGMYDYNTTGYLEGYRIGCAIETNIARQIARPADLKGNEVFDARDGQTDPNVIGARRATTPTRSVEQLDVYGAGDVGG